MQVSGHLIGLFSFDVGYEINLDQARTLAAEGARGSLELRRAAPTSLQYATPPLRLPLGSRKLPFGSDHVEAQVFATVHDFGAITIGLELPLACDITTLPALTANLIGAGLLEDAARLVLEELVRRLAATITNPATTPLVEDYYVLHLRALDPPCPIPELVRAHRDTLASALRCEPTPLSEAEVDEVFRTQLSYYPNDLVVTEWNVALVVDEECAETVSILEFLNVQLVELRTYDELLDRRLAHMYELTAQRARSWPLVYRPYRRAVDELATIRLDVAIIIERVHHALKLSGDLYLAKLYTRTAERLSLRAWEESVEGKLRVLEKMYEVFVQRVATARAEALEASIVALVLIELLVLLGGWG